MDNLMAKSVAIFVSGCHVVVDKSIIHLVACWMNNICQWFPNFVGLWHSSGFFKMPKLETLPSAFMFVQLS